MFLCSSCKGMSCNALPLNETHLKKRFICYPCLGERDIALLRSGRIVLSLKDGVLVNFARTLKFEVAARKTIRGGEELCFSHNQKQFVGRSYTGSPSIIFAWRP